MSIASITSEIEALIKRASDEAYARGKEDAKREMLMLLSPGVTAAQSEDEQNNTFDQEDDDATPQRKRAPRGLPKALTMRMLSASRTGLTPQQIVDGAQTENEQMIAVSTIRSELRKGQKSGLYKEVNGLWFLCEAEDNSVEGSPSASNFSHERKQDAPSVKSTIWD
ncbi:hypothetical protein [Pseudooceanicola sp.]|uniref:hypothetical protein n=1 Tax=Pseudooceanicola sp. TaxID=1914328 RepID=UPI002613777F|nr:hypothetical protein [Pseudooceanicola sp.]MDF1855016.1 hypothetical protein [Pseudooceanicola sp.]